MIVLFQDIAVFQVKSVMFRQCRIRNFLHLLNTAIDFSEIGHDQVLLSCAQVLELTQKLLLTVAGVQSWV